MHYHIRKATLGDEAGIANVHVASWRSTYRGIIKDQVLDQLSVEARAQSWQEALTNDELIYVAENRNREIIGFATGGKSRSPEYTYDGELYAIYLLQDYQQHGIGKDLIQHVANDLKALGYHSMIVWVLRDNPARIAYQRLGAVEIDSKEIQIGEESLVENVLVWKDINEQWSNT